MTDPRVLAYHGAALAVEGLALVPRLVTRAVYGAVKILGQVEDAASAVEDRVWDLAVALEERAERYRPDSAKVIPAFLTSSYRTAEENRAAAGSSVRDLLVDDPRWDGGPA